MKNLTGCRSWPGHPLLKMKTNNGGSVSDTANPTNALQHLMEIRNGLIIHQAVCAAARLGVADLLEQDVCTTEELATALVVNEDALYRILAGIGRTRNIRGDQCSHL